MSKTIPIIIPVFNQPTYLKNLINWWRWYHPDAPIYILDNASNSMQLIDFYSEITDRKIQLVRFPENNFIPNMRDFLGSDHMRPYDYYVISDPDIMPHPNTPMNFLQVWLSYMESKNLHRIGFNLITKELPLYLNERQMIIGNEAELLQGREVIAYEGFTGYKAPIDTTFCLYKKANGGWSAPMNGEDWGNCVRLFDAFHLGWYINGDNLNEEMEYYFKSSKYRVPGEASAGKNNNRPKQFQ